MQNVLAATQEWLRQKTLRLRINGSSAKTLFSGHYTKYTQIIYSKTVLPEKLVFVQLLGHLNVLFL